ncbi:hypothetical protein BC938DRAFT_478682 [Jimgerdemannia flammicorona]|uniref:Uncharacterized protein n=1 Tax=Jimgerdemannia flammicorona TaxID=994334 RepID=A0A433QMI5_9FUNG|nr:hypothetical protein BC938DRAFT_478682 [Jimgerdemannia flammicorona]
MPRQSIKFPMKRKNTAFLHKNAFLPKMKLGIFRRIRRISTCPETALRKLIPWGVAYMEEFKAVYVGTKVQATRGITHLLC